MIEMIEIGTGGGSIAGINDRQSVMDTLKDITYSLGDAVPEKLPKTRIKRPKRAPGSRVYP